MKGVRKFGFHGLCKSLFSLSGEPHFQRIMVFDYTVSSPKVTGKVGRVDNVECFPVVGIIVDKILPLRLTTIITVAVNL